MSDSASVAFGFRAALFGPRLRSPEERQPSRLPGPWRCSGDGQRRLVPGPRDLGPGPFHEALGQLECLCGFRRSRRLRWVACVDREPRQRSQVPTVQQCDLHPLVLQLSQQDVDVVGPREIYLPEDQNGLDPFLNRLLTMEAAHVREVGQTPHRLEILGGLLKPPAREVNGAIVGHTGVSPL